MSAKSIYESKTKSLLRAHLHNPNVIISPSVVHTQDSSITDLVNDHPWLTQQKLVVKPDQLIKRRGKLGLVKVGCTLPEAEAWSNNLMGKPFHIGATSGVLKRFLIEPLVPHQTTDEHYICIYATRDSDVILFHHAGGMDVGDVDSKAEKLSIPVGESCSADMVNSTLMKHVASQSLRKTLTDFSLNLHSFFTRLHFTYLEINPLVSMTSPGSDLNNLYILDAAARLDQCAEYLCAREWGIVEFPPPFGREAYPEEAYIADLDAKSGASLKLTLLNPKGRIWTMVAGGGASVIYADTICDMGGAAELANYGEYSGAPSETQTYEYAKTLLSLMTREKRDDSKVLIIGGSIANFTNVAATFKGIVRALMHFQRQLQEQRVSIFVRRGGPNFQEGLRVMRDLGENLGVPMHVFGPETHMTAIVGMALGHRDVPQQPQPSPITANFLLPSGANNQNSRKASLIKSSSSRPPSAQSPPPTAASGEVVAPLFTSGTKAVVWGMQNRAVQSMLDFDFVCSRKDPSVVAVIYPFVGNHKQKFYFGHKEILIPVYKTMEECFQKHPTIEVMVSFASLRSAYESSMDAMTYPQIRCVAIIAEGIPENLTRQLIKTANQKGVTIIGPATVGSIKPGCFKIGNTAGMMDNILASKLYRPGSVAYVSRSGGMSNELNNIAALNTDGVYEGVAIGGDRYPGSTFMDHVRRYQAEENVKMIIVLGEVGGTEEYDLAAAVSSGAVSKPVVAWCVGTCAQLFTSEVQFGHAGACANSEKETAHAKNKVLAEAGCRVPENFDHLGDLIRSVYEELVSSGVIVEKEEVPPPTVPMDYSWARELGLIRKPASFMTSICDERGQELLYAGVPITEIISQDFGVGGVLSLLWFRNRLPAYACKFIEMVLIVTADHGPAVSGAHNTIVCARAGKDLVSSLTSGLLTIGERFGGALDGAAKQFSEAYDTNLIPMEFVNAMRKKGDLIMGIGHRVKSINNPDKRVELLKDFALQNFPATPLLNYALEVEKITTSKKPNLILNVDGLVGVAMVDLLRNCGCFTHEEAIEYIEIGTLNGLFVLGRSIGFIGHYLDQRRLKQGLYRHPWDDISYVMPETMDQT